MAMEDGETVSFTAVNTSTRATQDVDVTRGTAYYYADYGLGSYVTYKYTVKFGNVSATAYCVQPSKAGPGMVFIRSPNWVTAKHWQKYATTAQRHPAKMDSFQKNILIFPLENSLSLFIWRHLMPITAVTLFPVRMQPDRHWQWNSTITA